VDDKRIEAAPAALPNDFRVAMYYIDVRGYTYADTAAMLNIPHGTVMSRPARGRKRLRVAPGSVAVNRGNFAVVERRIA
jgi:DNA-directed RNA polymerase specialized sigma24 family protein